MEERRAFYEYHAALMEPWDGPAAIAFPTAARSARRWTRNGLRPARYHVPKDDRIVMASEMGVLKIPEDQIVTKWRLQPARCCWSTSNRTPDPRRRDQGHAGQEPSLQRLAAPHPARTGGAA